ncbi:NepR family anti-sigma factor [Salinarimonas sp.]|uniref:NepR family anti-sigma factor n=1 Tax=Salinarimonas sp. TaxID=2766526 RepID=UPI0032D8DE5D
MKVNKGTGVHELGVRDVREPRDHEPHTADPKLDRAIQARIGDQLRAMYTELLEQPVPDRFRDLLEKLDQEKSKENSR